MAYNKPIEIKIESQNTKGTEVNAIRLLDTIEKQLKTVLKEGDLFKSPRASVDYNTHAVTKSFFVRSEAENLVRDIINLQKDNFYREPSITSNQARMRSYKVDIEGEKALAALRADTAALGGRVYGNQHGNYAEIPNYKGARKDALGRAEELTNKLRIKIADEAEREEERQEKQKRKEERQKEKEAEKEERQKEAAQKQHSIALIAGLSSSVMLLKKLVSLVENIVTSVIEQGQKSFETSMTAQRLNISPDLLRKIEYAGIAKGVGSAPVNAMLSLQDSFGSTLLAAKNIDKLTPIMPLIGADVEKLILNGSAGTNPLALKTMLMNRLLEAYQAGSDGLGGKVSKKASAASLTSLARSTLGDDFALEFSRAAADNATDYTAWLLDAMPVSSPSYNALNASSENYTQYNEALTEFRAALDVLFTQLSPVLNTLTVALETLTGWVMKLTGDKEGLAKFSEKNYMQAQESFERDSEERRKVRKTRYDYAVRNEDAFGGVDNAFIAMTDFLDSGAIPKHLKGDEDGITEFLAMAWATSLQRQLDESIRKSHKAITDYESNKSDYITGKKSLTFADTPLSATVDKAERDYTAKAWDYFASRVKAETPEALERQEAVAALGTLEANKYQRIKESIAKNQAAIEKESSSGSFGKALSYVGRALTGRTPNSEKFIKETQDELDKLIEALNTYEEKIETYRETGFGLGSLYEGVVPDISSYAAYEAMNAAIREVVVQTIYGGQLPTGYSYQPYTDPNQTGTLSIQIYNEKSEKVGQPIAVPAHLAAPFNESTSYFMQGD